MADEVEISPNDLLNEAEAFLKTTKASLNPDEEYHKYRHDAIRMFLQKDPSLAVLDLTLVSKMWGEDGFDADEFLKEFYDEEILFETRTKRITKFEEKRKIWITKDKVTTEYETITKAHEGLQAQGVKDVTLPMMQDYYPGKKPQPKWIEHLRNNGWRIRYSSILNEAFNFKYHYFEPDGIFRGHSFGVLLARALARKVGIENKAAVEQIKLFVQGKGDYALKFDDKTKTDYKIAKLSSSPGSPISVSDSPSPDSTPVGSQSASSSDSEEGGAVRPPQPKFTDVDLSDSESSRRSRSPETSPLSPTGSEASSGIDDLPTVSFLPPRASPLRLCVVSPAAGTADNPITL